MADSAVDDAFVFKALADPNRRILLDSLFRKDGQTLISLETQLDMTRFGVMKHLRILEEAGLVTTEKVGRQKHHYLNPVPIQLVYDRWVSKYAKPFSTKLSQLKYILEVPMNKIAHRYQIFIQATPERVWQALTSGEISPHYYFGTRVESTWETGSPYRYIDINNDDHIMLEGTILEAEPPYKLVQTFRPLWQPEALALTQSKVTWVVKSVGEGCSVTLLHEELDDTPFANNIIEGWSRILSGLKTFLETGAQLQI